MTDVQQLHINLLAYPDLTLIDLPSACRGFCVCVFLQEYRY